MEMQYAGFWRRLGAHLLDIAILLPLGVVGSYGFRHYRLFPVYYFAPCLMINLFYLVFLVRRFGGTPGKVIAGLQIVKTDGGKIGYREALLRCAVEFFLYFLGLVALGIAATSVSDHDYLAQIPSKRTAFLREASPEWHKFISWAQTAWVWGEFVVLLTNQKRRALHDFLAGTVVTIKKQPIQVTGGD